MFRALTLEGPLSFVKIVFAQYIAFRVGQICTTPLSRARDDRFFENF